MNSFPSLTVWSIIRLTAVSSSSSSLEILITRTIGFLTFVIGPSLLKSAKRFSISNSSFFEFSYSDWFWNRFSNDARSLIGWPIIVVLKTVLRRFISEIRWWQNLHLFGNIGNIFFFFNFTMRILNLHDWINSYGFLSSKHAFPLDNATLERLLSYKFFGGSTKSFLGWISGIRHFKLKGINIIRSANQMIGPMRMLFILTPCICFSLYNVCKRMHDIFDM